MIISPDADATVAEPFITSKTWEVYLYNVTTMGQSGPLTCEVTGKVSACSVSQSTFTIPGDGSLPITVTYSTASVGNGTLILRTRPQWPSATLSVDVASVQVTPDVQTTGVGPFAPQTQQFLVTNPHGSANTYAISPTCAPPATFGCTAPSSITVGAGGSNVVAVSYQSGAPGLSGTVRVRATNVTHAVDQDGGAVTITTSGGAPTTTEVSLTEAHPGTDVDRAMCLALGVGASAAFECGDLRLAHALPTVRTRNKPRTPMLIYNSRHAQGAAILPAVVTLAGGAPTPTRVTATLFVLEAGSWVTAANGEWDGAAFGAGQPAQIALSYQSTTGVSRLVQYRYEVTVWNGGTPAPPVAATGRFVLVDRSGSQFGAGWWLAGFEQLIPADSNRLVWIGGDGSTRLYVPSGVSNAWVASGLSRPDTLKYDVARYRYVRVLPHGVTVEFDNLARHAFTRNRLGDSTVFTFDDGPGQYGSLSLKWITVPRWTGPTYQFEYLGDSVRITAPPAGGQVRQTVVTRNFAGLVQRIRDPDQRVVQFESDAAPFQRRIVARTDRRGVRTRFQYGNGHVLSAALRDSAPNLPWSGHRFPAVAETKGLALPGVQGQAAPRDSVYTWHDGAREDVDALDHTRFWTTRHGAPRKIRNARGDETVIVRGDTRFPALVTELRVPNGTPSGFVTWATYDARGNMLATTQFNPLGDGRPATSSFAWDATWDFVKKISLPEGETTTLDYDGVTGNRLWQEDGRGSMSRVNFAYYGVGTAAVGLLRAVAYPGGARDSIAYDDTKNNLSGTRNALGAWTRITHDAAGRDSIVRKQIDAIGYKWQDDSIAYDLKDRPTRRVTYGPGSSGRSEQRIVVRSEYDAEGATVLVERRALDSDSTTATLTTRWVHDPAGRWSVEVAPDLKRDSTRFDPAGNVIELVNRRAKSITLRYDSLNRLVRRDVPPVAYAQRVNQGIGNLALTRGDHVPYPWYPLDPEAQSLAVPGDVAIFEYDAMGNLLVADNADAKIKRSYYPNGALQTDSSRIRNYLGADFSKHKYGILHRYDLNGRRQVLKHPKELAPRGDDDRGQRALRIRSRHRRTLPRS